MILTGPFIEGCVADGSIVIDPYDKKLVGPNSVDLLLHPEMQVYEISSYKDISPAMHESRPVLDARSENPTRKITIGSAGIVLQPNVLYLARTVERIGSKVFVPMVEGRSSCGRLGLQIHMTAGFCDTGFEGTITLEMTVVHPLRIYAHTAVAQVFFLRPEGEIRLYEGRYQGHVDATPSRIHWASEGAGRKAK